MNINLLHRHIPEDTAEHIEVNPDSPDQLRTQRMKKLINHLISIDDISSTEIQPIIDSLRIERDRNIAPLFHSLDNLVILSHRHPDAEETIDALLSNTADLVLDDFKEVKKIEKKSDIGISVVWSAIKAWDEVRDESTTKLCVAMLDNFHGAGRASLVYAYAHAKDTGLAFDVALDQANMAQALSETTDLGFKEALNQVHSQYLEDTSDKAA